jgi:hypothetical protein
MQYFLIHYPKLYIRFSGQGNDEKSGVWRTTTVRARCASRV